MDMQIEIRVHFLNDVSAISQLIGKGNTICESRFESTLNLIKIW